MILFALSAGLGASPAGAVLPDGRAWEMVSPVEKNGGSVDLPGTIAGGGAYQAAAQGSLITYSSATAFDPGAAGAPPASQYVAARGSSGWATQNISVPLFSGSYDFSDQGVPYRLFSPDLARGLLLNGDPCRGEAGQCPVANPALPGTDAPQGFQDYYLREGAAFEALIGGSDVAGRGLDPASFEARFEGASPDLKAVVLASCAPLAEAGSDGCATNAPNLYLWRQATGSLALVNESPGVELAAASGAVSVEGTRIYFAGIEDGPLKLREGATVYPVGAVGASFQAASTDGMIAFYTEGTHLRRYSTATHTSIDLTPSGGVAGVLGASADGSVVYYQDSAGLELWAEGTTTPVASGAGAADPSSWPPASGASRVTSGGQRLLFTSKAKLTGYDNTDKVTNQPDAELFLYDASGPGLTCLSCNPKGKRPIGASRIPGAYANGASFAPYKPRALSANGERVFFTSQDTLVTGDSNSNPITGMGVPDVYEWEAQGEGSCTQVGGCISILSNGALPEGATFLDASADGADAYFLTEASLVGIDPGSGDLYDARVGGGFPEAPPQIPCEGDACQILPPVPGEASLATLAKGAGNPPVTYRKYCRKGYYKHKGICIRKKNRRHRRGKGR
jgi:hypothetical protein